MLGASSRTRSNHLDFGSRRGPLGHPGVLLLLAAAVLFGAYALGYLSEFGSLLEAGIRSTRSTAFPALNPLFYGIAGLAAFLLLLSLLRSIDILLRRFQNAAPFAERPLKPLSQFIEEAAVGDISLRVAREGYHLLTPHYPHLMCIDLNDTLRGHLLLSDEEICLLDAQLLTRCDRRDAPVDAADLVTVFGLLHRAETATPLRAERPSGTRGRRTDPPLQRPVELAAELPAPPPRNSSSAQRKALHAAALLAIESRALRSAEASGLHRRSSDYAGPRRRLTDNHIDPVYKGPLRRASDRIPAESKTTPDPAKLNHLDPLFVPPLNQRPSKAASGTKTVPAPGTTVLTSDRPY